MVSELDLCQVPKIFRIKLKFFLEKVCWFKKKSYLCIRFQEMTCEQAKKSVL